MSFNISACDMSQYSRGDSSVLASWEVAVVGGELMSRVEDVDGKGEVM